MSVTAYTFPGTATQAVQGGSTWTGVTNVLANDGNYATDGFLSGADNFEYRHVRLLKAGIITGTDIGANQDTFTNPRTLGGSTQTFGQTLTPADVNDPNFGIAIAFGQFNGTTHADKTDYIKVTNFGFAVPTGASIDGIEILVGADQYSGGGGTSGLEVNYIQVRIYFSVTITVIGAGDSAGYVFSPNDHKTIPDKRFDYNVTNHAGTFLGKLPEPASDPTYKLAKNNLQSSMQITLPVNDNRGAVGIGPGQVVEVNNEIELIAYYGDFDAMVDEDGGPLLDEDYNVILGANGAPQGDVLFTGYISRWDTDYGGTDATVANLLTHSNELFNIMLETDDTAIVVNSIPDSGYIGIKGAGPSDNVALAQVIVATTTTTYSKITMQLRQNFIGLTISMAVWYGTPASVGSFITNTVGVQTSPPDTNGFSTYTFVFGNAIALNSGDTITAYVDVDFSKTGGGAIYPADWETGGGYASGKAWLMNSAGGGWVQQSNSLLFTLWKAGGSTDVTYTNTDPGDILKSMIDFAAARGSRIRYTATSITPTATRVTVTMKGVSVGEAAESIPEISPADWFVTFDPGSNIVYLRQRPAVPDHTITLGRNVATMKLGKSIENMVNQEYFSGGGSPSVYVKVTDQPARNLWRPGLGKGSNNNVLDVPTAKLIAQSDIDRKKNPEYYGTVTIFSKDYYIEDVVVGELEAFANYGSFVDFLTLQAASTTYGPDSLDIELDTLPPKTQPLVEDIQRDLNNIAAEDNPSTPTT